MLDAGGIAVGTGPARRHFSFGAARAEVEALAAAVFAASPDRTDNAECGAGPMAFSDYGALTLNFQAGKLVGWLVEAGGSAGIVTSDGITPGLTLGDLRRERPVTIVTDSTLEGEFEYAVPDGSSIGGFAKGTGEGARIESLYAGTNCFFR